MKKEMKQNVLEANLMLKKQGLVLFTWEMSVQSTAGLEKW